MTRVARRALLALGALLPLVACERSSRAPTPTGYRWPDTLSWRLEVVLAPQRDGRPLAHYADTRTLHLRLQDDRYLMAADSVLKTLQDPRGVQQLPWEPEDTLASYISLDRRGHVTEVRLGCDAALPACARALPGAILLQLARIVPRLPVWEAPRQSGWMDTIQFDDAARPGGTRGTVVTAYHGARDTVIGTTAYWVIPWTATRQSFARATGITMLAPEQPVTEEGVTFVDKQRALPVYATWAGVAPAPPLVRAQGAERAGFRGRAYLTGSVFDSMYGRQMDR